VSGRLLWFAAGAGAGLYTTFRARRLAYRLTPQGLGDQVAALGLGARAFAEEVRAGMAEREKEIAAELGLPAVGTGRAPGPALELIAARDSRVPAATTPPVSSHLR
jgi:hypothetical protein